MGDDRSWIVCTDTRKFTTRLRYSVHGPTTLCTQSSTMQKDKFKTQKKKRRGWAGWKPVNEGEETIKFKWNVMEPGGTEEGKGDQDVQKGR